MSTDASTRTPEDYEAEIESLKSEVKVYENANLKWQQNWSEMKAQKEALEGAIKIMAGQMVQK